MHDNKWPQTLLAPTDHFIDVNQRDFHLYACVGPQLPDEYGKQYYSDGFRLSARRLVEQLIEPGDIYLPVDFAVYPIIFLYRHHFELLLKMLIIIGRKFLREPSNPPFGHQLDKLWVIARPIVESCLIDSGCGAPDWSQNDIVTSLISELSHFDPNGEAGRYPESSKGEKHFQSISRLHIRHFAEVAERLSDYLSSILAGIEHTCQERWEWESYMISEYKEYDY